MLNVFRFFMKSWKQDQEFLSSLSFIFNWIRIPTVVLCRKVMHFILLSLLFIVNVFNCVTITQQTFKQNFRGFGHPSISVVLVPLIWRIIAYTYWCSCVWIFVIPSASRWQCIHISGGNWEWKNDVKMCGRWYNGVEMHDCLWYFSCGWEGKTVTIWWKCVWTYKVVVWPVNWLRGFSRN